MNTESIYALRRGNTFAYVGRTQNLERRTKQHRRSRAFDDVVTLAVVPKFSGAEVEAAAIIILNPRLNRKQPSTHMADGFRPTSSDLAVFLAACRRTIEADGRRKAEPGHWRIAA